MDFGLKLIRWIGRKSSYFLLGLALLTFLVVVLRYAFNLSWVWMQELIVYFHSLVFLCTAAWAVTKDKHVRVDLVYSNMTSINKRKVEKWGALFFLAPMAGLIFYTSFPYVWDSWEVLESSTDSAGLPLVFLLKSLILVFALSLLFVAVVKLRKPHLFTENSKDSLSHE